MRSFIGQLAFRFDPATRERVRGLSRREVLRAAGASAAALMLSGLLRPARALAQRKSLDGARKVVVIGGGLAGLACAFELAAAEYDVRVVEARQRVGGRVLTFKDFLPGANVEAGGEFIGANHPTWLAYAERFGLEMLHVGDDENLSQPVLVGGKLLGSDELERLYGELSVACGALSEQAAAIDEVKPWLSPEAEVLDRRSLAQWLDGVNIQDPARSVLRAELSSPNGADLEQSSLLAMLACVKGGGLARYWSDSEALRCDGGNQQLASALAAALSEGGAGRLMTGQAVAAISVREDGGRVTLSDGTVLEADEVVLAVPPSVWERIRFEPALPAGLTPQMGANVKFLSRVDKRFWRDRKQTADAMGECEITTTWEATDGQEIAGGGAVLTGFSGAARARALCALDGAARDGAAEQCLESYFAGYSQRRQGVRFVDWMSEAYTQGSYCFPSPGEVTTLGPIMAAGLGPGAAPRLHIAGEHACYGFVGYMEGALSSGVAAAKRIAARDGVPING